MTKRVMTYFLVLAGIVFRPVLSWALITDPVNNVLKNIQVQEKKIGTFQEDYVNQYTQLRSGKIGSLGDVSMIEKATKKIEQAQKAMERLQKEKESLEKKVAKVQEFKDNNLGKLKEYSEQVSGLRERINKEREKINKISEQVKDKKQQLEEAKGMFINKEANQNTDTASEDLELIVGDADLSLAEGDMQMEILQEETVIVRPAVVQNQFIKYELPAMAQDGALISSATAQPQMTMLPKASEEAVAFDRLGQLTTGITNLNTALPQMPEVTVLKQLPQLSAEEFKQGLTSPMTVQAVASQEQVQRSLVPVEEQLISSDDISDTTVENPAVLDETQDARPILKAKRSFTKDVAEVKAKMDASNAVLPYQGEKAVFQDVEAKAALPEKMDAVSAKIRQITEKTGANKEKFAKLPVKADKKAKINQVKTERQSFKKNIAQAKRQIRAKGDNNE